MAKRRTKEQIDSDKIIREKLMDFGEKVYEQAKENSRVAKDQYYKTDRVEPKGSLRKAGGTLRDSINYRPLTDTTLLLTQVYYGKYQQPNELQVAIDDNIDETINLVVADISEQLTSNFN